MEAELKVRPIANLELIANYTYLDAEKTSSADINQLPGARLPRRPRNEVYVSATYLWFGKLRTTAEAKCVNAREELNFGGPNFDIEDYAFVNFAAEYEISRHLFVFGRINNLTDEHYAEVFGFPALGRAAYGGVRVGSGKTRRNLNSPLGSSTRVEWISLLIAGALVSSLGRW